MKHIKFINQSKWCGECSRNLGRKGASWMGGVGQSFSVGEREVSAWENGRRQQALGAVVQAGLVFESLLCFYLKISFNW